MKRPSLHTLVLALAFLMMAGICSAQGPTTGIPPFGSFGGGPFDTVNLGNLNVYFKIPVFHKAGRGMPFAYDLSYDSSVWYPLGVSGSQTWVPAGGNWGWQGVTSSTSSYVSYSTSEISGVCGQYSQFTWQQWTFNNFVDHDSNGNSHNFNYTTQYVTSNDNLNDNSCPPTQSIPAAPVPTVTTDGSGYTLYASPGAGQASAYLTSASGLSVYPATTTDANGNQISNNNGVFTDTLGTTAVTLTGSGNPSSPVKLIYAAPGGSAQYTVNYSTYTVKTNFGCSGVTEYGPTAVNLVSSVTLPDSSSYTFTYEPTPSYSGDVTGRLHSVTLPTGGVITYQYTGGSNGIVCADGTTAGFTRTLNPGGTWTYSRVSKGGNHWQTTVTDPTGAANQTLIDFQEDGTGTQNFYETQRQTYAGSVGGRVVGAMITCYNTANPTPSSCPATPVSTPISRQTVFSYAYNTSDSSKVAEVDTRYSYINDPNYPTEVDSYDYGVSSPASTAIRKVVTQYGQFGSNGLVQPTSVQVQDGSGSVKASTTYSYDESTPATTSGTPQHIAVSGGRGNLTTLATQASSGLTLYRKFTYYDTGNVQTATDTGTSNAGGSNITTYNYSNSSNTCGNSFADGISEPLTLSKSFTWDCNGAVMTSGTDENGQTTRTYYTGSNFGKSADAAFWRPYATTDQLGNATTLSYPNENASESTLAFNGNASVADNRVTLDGFGRPIVTQKQQGYNSANYDSVQTGYDSSGRIGWVTQPYSASAGSTCSSCVSTTTTYDELNRPAVISDAGGGTLGYTRTWNDVLGAVGPPPTGEIPKQRQMEYDVLGRVASVCELSSLPGSGTCGQSYALPGFWTTYTYDVLGDITGVTQNAQAASGSRQTRTYAYDMLGRLTSQTNPETNSIAATYIYDSWDGSCGSYSSPGDLVEKKDPVGNVTCYQYDGLHRVTSLTYPAGSYSSNTDQKHYVYDAATVNGTVMGNAKGRLAEAYTCAGSCTPKKTDLGFSYSPRGELTDAWESTPNSGGYYHPSTTFWANGALKTLWISSLPTISYGADGEGRASTVSASSGQNPVTAASYNVYGEVTGVTYGSADSDSYGFDSYTGRMTQYKFSVNGSSEIGNLTWNANGSLKTLAITDPFHSADSQTCNYTHDDLARIASVNCGSPWSQNFSYDAFGNITKSGSITWNPGYSSTTNRYTLTGTSYDTNGNLLADTFHSYTWNSESNPVKIDSINLTYDAFDRVVEQNPSSGLYYQIVYTPMGTKLGLFKGATIQQLYVPLPGGAQAEYYSWGLSDYRHADWLGSDRLESSTTRTIIDNNAYAPYGEPYAQTGNGEISFTGQNKDTTWLQYDFMFRQYDPKQGRWISPDPAGVGAVDPTNPQTWNRYAYVANSPLSWVDPLGLAKCPPGSGDWCVDVNDSDPTNPTNSCTDFGYGMVAQYTVCGPPGWVQQAQSEYDGSNQGSSNGGGSTPPPTPPAPPKPPNPKPGPPKPLTPEQKKQQKDKFCGNWNGANYFAGAWSLGFAFSGVGTGPSLVVGAVTGVSAIAQGMYCGL